MGKKGNLNQLFTGGLILNSPKDYKTISQPPQSRRSKSSWDMIQIISILFSCSSLTLGFRNKISTKSTKPTQLWTSGVPRMVKHLKYFHSTIKMSPVSLEHTSQGIQIGGSGGSSKRILPVTASRKVPVTSIWPRMGDNMGSVCHCAFPALAVRQTDPTLDQLPSSGRTEVLQAVLPTRSCSLHTYLSLCPGWKQIPHHTQGPLFPTLREHQVTRCSPSNICNRMDE